MEEIVSTTDQVEETPIQEVDYKQENEKLSTELKKLQVALTRQGGELGELRKLKPLVDQMLTQQEKKEPVDFFSDPDKAMEQKIASDPRITQLMQQTANIQKQESLAKLANAHPDFKEIVADDGFKEWIEKSKIRTALLMRADADYDFDSADELLTTWKERQALVSTAKDGQKQTTDKAMKAAKVDSGTAVTGKKVYSRLDLMNLKITNPDRYRSLNVEQLYREGRVR